MTDERQGEALWKSLERLPEGSGVVFRHLATEAVERQKLLRRVRRIARKRRLVLLVMADRGRWRGPIRAAAVHSVRELVAAERRGAELLFVSPVFATRTHPGERSLGRVRFGLLARRAHVPVIALGGVTVSRSRGLGQLGAYGWAAIDGLTIRT